MPFGCRQHDGRAPTGDRIARDAPLRFAHGYVNADRERLILVLDLHDNRVAGHGWRGRHSRIVAGFGPIIRQASVPLQIPVSIKAQEIVRGVKGEDALTVARRRRSCNGAHRMAERATGRPEFPAPQFRSVSGIERQDAQSILRGAPRTRDEDSVPHDDWAGRSSTRQFRCPGDLVRSVIDARSCCTACDARAGRTAELRPIAPPARRRSRRGRR